MTPAQGNGRKPKPSGEWEGLYPQAALLHQRQQPETGAPLTTRCSVGPGKGKGGNAPGGGRPEVNILADVTLLP